MPPAAPINAAPIDGAQLAILHNRLNGVTRKMSNTLFRTGRSGVLTRVRDFSCCIVTADCELIAVAEALPIHVLAGADMMARAMKQFHPKLKPGDAFLHNSPYHGCGHAADHTILVPVFDGGGTHRFTVLAKAHQADIGNSIPTTYHGAARDVFEEGALIFPAVQVARDYEVIDDIVRMCRMRIRVPEQWSGDFLAMMGAARIGERELTALAGEVGWEKLDRFCTTWLDYSEQRCAEAIRRLPAATTQAISIHDTFPGLPAEGVAIKAIVTSDPVDGYVHVDLTDNPDCTPNGLNLSEASSLTAAYMGVFNSLDGGVPKNAGSMRRFRVTLRDNCICGIPRHPTSCSLGTSNISERVANAVAMAMATLGEGIGMAETGSGAPGCGVISGIDPRTGAQHIDSVTLAFTGGAASARADAWVTIGAIGGGGQAFLDSIELTELYQPIEIVERVLLADTEGAGRKRGAPSLRVEFGPVGGSFDFGFFSDGLTNGPKGVRGGGTGGTSAQVRRTVSGALEPIDACGQATLLPGETLIATSSGGGGYGNPRDRDRAAVREDLAEGWITTERARTVYGLTDDA